MYTNETSRIARLRRLVEAHGVAGFEGQIQTEVLAQIGSQPETHKDMIGNVVASHRNDHNTPHVLIEAHADEIGLITTTITTEGFLRFRPIGRWRNEVLIGQRVSVLTSEASIPGVIGTTPPHVLPPEKREKPTDMVDMFIDVGAEDRHEASAMGIRPGTPIVPAGRFEFLSGGKRVIGKAFDNRVGLGVVLEAFAEIIADNIHPNVITLASTVQEELGKRGAEVLVNSIKPDLAIVLEGILTGDVPGVNEDTIPGSIIGAGPNVVVHDDGMVPQPKLVDWIAETATSAGLPFQLTPAFGGNDAEPIHLANQGVPTIVLGVPCRYIHSYNSLMDLNDYDRAIELVKRIVNRADTEQLELLR